VTVSFPDLRFPALFGRQRASTPAVALAWSAYAAGSLAGILTLS
jgi:hypothetical protein